LRGFSLYTYDFVTDQLKTFLYFLSIDRCDLSLEWWKECVSSSGRKRREEEERKAREKAERARRERKCPECDKKVRSNPTFWVIF